MQYLSAGEGSVHDKRKQEMQRLNKDPQARIEFLLRQSMIDSLEQEKLVA